MQNLWTIFRRELAAYYTSAIGYIFIMVFLSLSVGLFMTPFFTFLTADMRAFFTTVPILMCIFLPAVTMRLWAEERKQNTWEMLLTFPMQPHELVLGKFAASFLFFLSALAGTLTVPLMLVVLGNPDPGRSWGPTWARSCSGRFSCPSACLFRHSAETRSWPLWSPCSGASGFFYWAWGLWPRTSIAPGPVWGRF